MAPSKVATAEEKATKTAEDKARIAEKSYQEVLAGLKHQDDKLNRTLTALAFLTGGAIALFPKLNAPGVIFNESGPPVTAFFFVSFLFAVAVALVIALVAIGPSTSLTFPSAPRPPGSRIFYAAIARESDDEWNARFERSAEEQWVSLMNNYRDEAKIIAGRVSYKIGRAREAAAFVHLAIVCLALMGIFRTTALGPNARWWIAAALLGGLLWLPFWELVQAHNFGFSDKGSPWAYAVLAAAVISATVLLITGRDQGHEWKAVYVSLAVLVAARLSLTDRKLAVVLVPGVAIAAVVVLIVAL